MSFSIRQAKLTDVAEITELIGRSMHALGADDYTRAQIDGALQGAFGVDTRIIIDGTYYVIEVDAALVACGGWSRRKTLFGADTRTERDDVCLDPQKDAARIRAFFVDPSYARRGIGRQLLLHCEAAARGAGFSRFALMATLPGVRLYAACGYLPAERIDYDLPNGETILFVPMHKSVWAAT